MHKLRFDDKRKKNYFRRKTRSDKNWIRYTYAAHYNRTKIMHIRFFLLRGESKTRSSSHIHRTNINHNHISLTYLRIKHE